MSGLREERTREIPLGPGFAPGDVVGIEMGSLRHRTELREVLAVFCKDGGDEGYGSCEITLRGRPKRVASRRHRPSEDKVSRVTLAAVIPANAASGEYRCLRLEAETSSGRRAPFEPVTAAAWRGWRFRVQ